MSDWFRDQRLYVAEFKSGLIKVGITSSPGDRRIRNLEGLHGAIVRHHFTTAHQSMGFFTERTLYLRLAQIGHQHKGREWFTGVRFGLAKQLADQVTRAARLAGITCHKSALAQSDESRIEGADEGSDSLLSHGKKFTAQATFNHRQVA